MTRRGEIRDWQEMCSWDTLAVTAGATRTTATTSTAACHVMQGFIDRCAELKHVYSDWRITARCRECLDCSHVMHWFGQFVLTDKPALNSQCAHELVLS